MELVDVLDSKPSAFGRVGSTPTLGTILLINGSFTAHFEPILSSKSHFNELQTIY